MSITGELYVLPFDNPRATLESVGGKGANLARMWVAGLPVPGGFLVATSAYRAFVEANGLQPSIIDAARGAQLGDPASLEAASARIREAFSSGTMPGDLRAALVEAYRRLGEPAVAVRSSATAEDLPGVSFAGQQDTYLNVNGEEALLRAVVDCWASLWTARAIGYRARQGIPPEDVGLGVAIQELVPSEVSGVLFTADPLTGKRSQVVIDAVLGLGEALVGGQVEPDHYVVDGRTGRILSKTLGSKARQTVLVAGGGTTTAETTDESARRQALDDDRIAELARMAMRVQDLYESPQDIEWAWSGGRLYLLQARPITSLYPAPDDVPAGQLRIYLSFGAVQGVLDPLTPLGRSTISELLDQIIQAIGIREAGARMPPLIVVAGERLWIDFTPAFRNPAGRRIIRLLLGGAEPVGREAVLDLWDEPDLMPPPDKEPVEPELARRLVRSLAPAWPTAVLNMLTPGVRRPETNRRFEAAVAEVMVENLAARTLEESAAALVAAPHRVIVAVKSYLLPAVVPGMLMLALLNRIASRLPGGEHDALEMTRGMPGNVTTLMDLALWETARRIKADSQAFARLTSGDSATLAAEYLRGELPQVAQEAISRFMRRYGMRGPGEFDLGRPRWRDEPEPVMQVLRSYVQIESDDRAPDAVFRKGAKAAKEAIERLARAERQTTRGRLKARLVIAAARRMRAYAGLRESPKFAMVRIFGTAREGLLRHGRRLVAEGVLDSPDDLFYLELGELQRLAKGERPESADADWRALVSARREAYERERSRKQVPRVLLSDGRAFYGSTGTAAGTQGGERTIQGNPVSPGVVEGVVRVVLDPAAAHLAPGEIMVCPATDPGWTPLFLAASGLVMEVGGLMTHGAVVAREYGIPAVVGVPGATMRLHTGERIRVDGSKGTIQVLD